MPFVLWEILLPLIIALLLGLFFGWLWWGWRRTKITYTEWETMRQKAARSSSVEAEAEIAELRAERDRLQAEIDDHVCDSGAAAVGTGVLGIAGEAAGDGTEAAAPAGDQDDRHPYGPGSHAPLDDPTAMPDGYTIKGNADSMLYHRPDSRSYAATIAEVWFDTAESAEASGFTLANSHPS